MKRTTILILVVILGIVSIFTGCTNGDSVTDTQTGETNDSTVVSDKEEAGKTTITVWWAEGDEFKASFLEAVKEYETTNPDVSIQIEWTPNFDYYDQYKIALIGEEAPDVVKIDHVFVQTLGYTNQIWDLAEFGANDVKDQFLQSTWEANMYKDSVFALPFDANTLALMYNKDLLDEASVQPPTTLEELIEVSTAVKALNKEGVYGYTIPFDPGASGFLSFQFVGWIARNGGTILNDDWSAATLNTPEVIEALYQLKSLVDSGAAPANVFMEPDFYAGSVGMLEMGPWHVPTITAEDLPAEFGIAPVVSLKEGVNTYSPLGLYSLAVAKQSKNPEAAYNFVEFLATNESLHIAFSKATNLMPSLTSTYSDEFYNDDVWQIFIEQLEHTVSRPGTPAWPEIDQVINDMIQSVLLDVATPEEAVQTADQAVNDALAAID